MRPRFAIKRPFDLHFAKRNSSTDANKFDMVHYVTSRELDSQLVHSITRARMPKRFAAAVLDIIWISLHGEKA
jgi:hypothetical protein